MCEDCCEELSNHNEVDWNCVDANNNIPLHIAIHTGNVEDARSIMEVYGVDHTLKDENGYSVVDLVVPICK